MVNDLVFGNLLEGYITDRGTAVFFRRSSYTNRFYMNGLNKGLRYIDYEEFRAENSPVRGVKLGEYSWFIDGYPSYMIEDPRGFSVRVLAADLINRLSSGEISVVDGYIQEEIVYCWMRYNRNHVTIVSTSNPEYLNWKHIESRFKITGEKRGRRSWDTDKIYISTKSFYSDKPKLPCLYIDSLGEFYHPDCYQTYSGGDRQKQCIKLLSSNATGVFRSVVNGLLDSTIAESFNLFVHCIKKEDIPVDMLLSIEPGNDTKSLSLVVTKSNKNQGKKIFDAAIKIGDSNAPKFVKECLEDKDLSQLRLAGKEYASRFSFKNFEGIYIDPEHETTPDELLKIIESPSGESIVTVTEIIDNSAAVIYSREYVEGSSEVYLRYSKLFEIFVDEDGERKVAEVALRYVTAYTPPPIEINDFLTMRGNRKVQYVVEVLNANIKANNRTLDPVYLEDKSGNRLTLGELHTFSWFFGCRRGPIFSMTREGLTTLEELYC